MLDDNIVCNALSFAHPAIPSADCRHIAKPAIYSRAHPSRPALITSCKLALLTVSSFNTITTCTTSEINATDYWNG